MTTRTDERRRRNGRPPVAFGVAGVLLLAWGVIVLISKAGVLQGWLVAVPLIASSVWLLRRSAGRRDALGRGSVSRDRRSPSIAAPRVRPS